MFEANDFNLYSWASNPKTATGKLRTLWDSKYFYILAEITTDPNFDFTASQSTVWERDSLGVFVDYSYKRDENYKYSLANGDIYEYLNIQADGKYYGTYGTSSVKPEDYPEILISSEKNATGYVMEIAIPLSKPGLKIGEKVGFDVNICEADSGKRVGVTAWNANATDMWQYSNVLGTITLGGSNAPKEEPKEEPETDDNTTSPTTGDFTALMVAAVLASAGSALIISKKKVK
ncbi:hypothetical protein SDC9_123381 [bioreactor metagenome]|uniref:Carbohydrate-binding domain-containing protein n=1 Tax=bioreactor metagenome TaxID=1076179 RepID=A0A645CHG0_9ZZZZ